MEESTGRSEQPRLVMVELDHESGEQRYFRSDDKVATLPLEDDLRVSWLRQSTWILDPPALFFETRAGGIIEAEIASLADLAPIGGRPVIYLDQNGWSTLAKAIHEPSRVRPRELPRAVRLIQLAMQRRVILPMSFAHLSETSQWSNDAGRYSLALTILELSRGWQMRNALTWRGLELRNALGIALLNQEHPTPPVFTLEPFAIYGSRKPLRRPAGFTDEQAYLHAALVSATTLSALALDPEASPRPDPGTWKDGQQMFSDWLRGETDRSKHLRRRSALVKALVDVEMEIARASAAIGATPEQMSAWVRANWFDPFPNAPAFALTREVYVDRHLAGVTWVNNDLNDMFYLCTAAAYADLVLAENHLGGFLRQASKRLGVASNVSTSFAELLPRLPPLSSQPEAPTA